MAYLFGLFVFSVHSAQQDQLECLDIGVAGDIVNATELCGARSFDTGKLL